MTRVRATHRHARAGHYRRPGGPWDVPTLDGILTDPPLSADAARGEHRAGMPHDALVDGDIRLTAGELDELTACLAGGLRDLGVGRRDVVAWQLANGYEAVLLFRACWRLGAIAAPIHHQLGAAAATALVERLAPVVVLGGAALPLGLHPGAVVVGGPSLPARRGKAAAGDHPAVKHFARLLAAEPELTSAAQPADLAVVLFTAGSGGSPKGVLHTHRGLAGKALSMPAVHDLGPADTVLMPAPLAHISGLLNGVLVPGVAGMKAVLMPHWKPALALDLIERERVSFMIGPPTFFVGLQHDPSFSTRRVRSLRLLSVGGAGVSEAFVNETAATFGATVKRSYGSTEAPTVTTWTPGDDPAEAATTDGHATGDTEVKIVDRATAAAVESGREGEIVVRGPELFAGYLDEDQTRAAFAPGGWFRTGDLGVLDRFGRLRVTGRLGDVIIRGGENISTGQVEAVLEAHPAIRQAVVVGYPDEMMGERVAAVVVVGADGSFDLAVCRAWFTAQGAARFTTPERILVVDELPTLAAGKPDRVALRALAARSI